MHIRPMRLYQLNLLEMAILVGGIIKESSWVNGGAGGVRGDGGQVSAEPAP